MRLKIIGIKLKNFKGIANKELVFDGSSKICGENGSGKSTCATAVSWVMTDTDYTLVKNPDVVPIGSEEANPTVEIDFELDGKPLNVAKVQKFKKKEVDGKITSSVSNTYSINGVDKTFTHFVEDLKERGIDIDNFLIYTNPNAFTADTSSKGRQHIREVLFKMAGEFTDLDIAKEIGADEVASQLENYKLEEIKASAKGTIKTITEENGKDNGIINGKISGMIESKSKLDKKVLESQKKEYEKEIERIETSLSDLSGSRVEINKKISDLKIKQNEISSKANEKLNEQKVELDKSIREFSAIISEKEFNLSQAKTELSRTESSINEKNESIEKQRTLYKIEQDAVLDEGDLSCPVCHRTYEEDKLAEIKAEFERNKAEKLKTIKATGETLKKEITALEKAQKELKDKIDALEKVIAETKVMRDAKQAEIEKLPYSVDVTTDKNYTKASEEISKLEAELSADDSERIKELETQKNVNKQMLHQVVSELGALEHNKEIDKQIEELREKRKNDEIAKSKAEKLIDEIEKVERAKNEKLADSINEHFSLVKWKLHDYRKNGEYVEVTEPYIDDKPMTSCANGSLITLAKLSICSDLGKFFGHEYPIWCDDYSLFSKNTQKRLKIDAQLIGLVVTEDKEIKVVKEK